MKSIKSKSNIIKVTSNKPMYLTKEKCYRTNICNAKVTIKNDKLNK